MATNELNKSSKETQMHEKMDQIEIKFAKIATMHSICNSYTPFNVNRDNKYASASSKWLDKLQIERISRDRKSIRDNNLIIFGLTHSVVAYSNLLSRRLEWTKSR